MTTTLNRPIHVVPLYQGVDLAKIEELRAALLTEATQTVTGPRLLSDTEPDGVTELRAAADAHDAFVRDAETRAVMITLEALPKKKWRELVDKHPARTVTRIVKNDDGTDRTVEEAHPEDTDGFNHQTMADDLVPASVMLVRQDETVQFATETARDTFIDNLSDPHFNALYDGAIRLNTGGAQVPKAEAFSLVDRIIAATSTSRDDSD